jgi:ribosome-associated protein
MSKAADSPSAAQPFPPVAVEPPISLGRFLKLAGLVDTGGDAKMLVGTGTVMVNGEVETRRGRKLWPGDTVESHDFAVRVSAAEGSDYHRAGTQPTEPSQ